MFLSVCYNFNEWSLENTLESWKKFVTTRSYRLKMIDLEKMSFISNKTNSVVIKLKQNIGI